MKNPLTVVIVVVVLAWVNEGGLYGQITTFVSPSAGAYDEFGYAVAAVGTDRVLIGDPGSDVGTTNSGAAYLFDRAGNLITAYTNPTPAVEDNFGNAVAAVGSNRVLISAWADDGSAYNAGVVYLFDLAGHLITTYTNPNPTPGSYFGYAVAGLEPDRAIIGANAVAYLYDLQGMRMATCHNPTPEPYDAFGTRVAAVGTNRLLVTAYNDSSIQTSMGMAYLFDLAGNLVTTYTNPTPAVSDSFGYSAAGVGGNCVLIGATRDDAGAEDAGAAYLFDLVGRLITTFTNPAPYEQDRFGASVAAVGTDHVLISATYGHVGAVPAGVAYLFHTNGALLMTLTDPTPAIGDYFGCSVTALGTNQVLIGAYNDSAAAHLGGAAYLFSATPPPPALRIVASGPGQAKISWSPATPGWVLQETLSLLAPAWTNISSGATSPVTVPTTLPARFYRLHKP